MADKLPNFNIKLTRGLQALEEKPGFAERIASGREYFDELLLLVQRDAVNEENRQTAGDVVYAIKRAMETIEYLSDLGNDRIAKTKKLSEQPVKPASTIPKPPKKR